MSVRWGSRGRAWPGLEPGAWAAMTEGVRERQLRRRRGRRECCSPRGPKCTAWRVVRGWGWGRGGAVPCRHAPQLRPSDWPTQWPLGPDPSRPGRPDRRGPRPRPPSPPALRPTPHPNRLSSLGPGRGRGRSCALHFPGLPGSAFLPRTPLSLSLAPTR